VAQDQHERIDFHWRSGSPHPAVGADGFSARWTRYIDIPAGTYRFTATSDDGMRVYVDGLLLMNQWYDHPSRTTVADVSLAPGHHLLVVEYYENRGWAVAKLSWEPITDTRHPWRGEYFGNRRLAGRPVMVRDDAQIDFAWGYGSPSPGIPADGFSVRWKGTLRFEAGSYRFTTRSDDGVRLWVNGHLLIDHWHDQSLRSHSGTIYLTGDSPLAMEYYENGGVAAVQLTWTRVDDDPPPPPPDTVVVDDGDAGFVKGGAARAWRTAAEGYGEDLLWTWNNDRVRADYNWARWYPDLGAGRYEVFVHIPDRYSTTSHARYWISHRNGLTLREVDQSSNGGGWISLGTYPFRGNRQDYASLADVTFEPYLSRLIAFDAVKWVRR
jgi:hypothetical protein